MNEEKWNIMKSLSMSKKAEIYDCWGWGMDKKVKIEGGLKVVGYHISESAMMSLAPGAWVCIFIECYR